MQYYNKTALNIVYSKEGMFQNKWLNQAVTYSSLLYLVLKFCTSSWIKISSSSDNLKIIFSVHLVMVYFFLGETVLKNISAI